MTTNNTKTYILKYDCYNDDCFPAGTIVKVNDPKWEFEVVIGKMKGQKGHIADGMNRWLVDNTLKNRNLLKVLIKKEKSLLLKIKKIQKQWKKVKPVLMSNLKKNNSHD